MPFIIWGSKGVTSNVANGDFHCPNCGTSPYTHKRVQRYFTLYWIPLFPLNTLGEYVECELCAQGYDPEILAYDPSEGMQVFFSQLDLAARRLMAAMVIADGAIDEAELQAMVEASEKLPGGMMSLEEAQAAVDDAMAHPAAPVDVVRDVKDMLNDQGKQLLLYVACEIAGADGDIADDEKMLLLQIGEALDLDVTEQVASLGT